MFYTRWAFGLDGSEPAIALRRKLFVERAGVSEKDEFDWFDGIAAHLLVLRDADDAMLAAGRIYPDGDLTRIDRIAADPDFPAAAAMFDLALRLLLYKAEQLAGEFIVSDVDMTETALYTPFGFKAQGEPFIERNAARVLMSVPRGGVIWDSPCKHQK